MDVEELWSDYKSDPTDAKRDALAVSYLPLIEEIAEKFLKRIGKFAPVETGDLISIGYLALVNIIPTFNSLRGVKFSMYARRRIHGAFLDELRKLDWVPRNQRQRKRKIKNAAPRIEGRATDDRLAKELGLTGDQMQNWLSQLNPDLRRFRSTRETETSRKDHIEPWFTTQSSDLARLVSRQLTNEEYDVLILKSVKMQTIKQIAAITGLPTGRVVLLHRRAVNVLRSALAGRASEFRLAV